MRIVAALLTLATVGATLTAGAVPALAQDQMQVSVQYNDLNLGSAAGRATLSGRIDNAAARVCGIAPAQGLKEIQSVRSCRTAAVASAWDQLTATAQAGQVRGTR